MDGSFSLGIDLFPENPASFPLSNMKLLRTDRVPPGGWNYVYVTPQGKKLRVKGNTLNHLVAQVGRVAMLNKGVAPTKDEVEHHICSRNNGNGCTDNTKSTLPQTTKASKARVAPAITEADIVKAKQAKRKTTPADYGARLWGYLHHFGVVFDRIAWLATVAHVDATLKSPTVGCAKCANHFLRWRMLYPEANVDTEAKAAVWTWMAHNQATQSRGFGEPMSFNDAAWIYAWEPNDDPEGLLKTLQGPKELTAEQKQERRRYRDRMRETDCAGGDCFERKQRAKARIAAAKATL